MGHDVHFLERLERVNPEHQALALSLYRDPTLVKSIVGSVCAQAGIPDDAADARVALALEDGGDGPHVIVSRNGRFVTCLAKGMSSGPWPILSRAMLDANTAWRKHSLSCKDYKSDEMDALFRSVFTHDQWPSRAQIEELAMFCPFHLASLARGLADIVTSFYKVQDTLLRVNRRSRHLLAYGTNTGKALSGWGLDLRAIIHSTILVWLGVQHGAPMMRAQLESHLLQCTLSLIDMKTPSAMLRAIWIVIQLEYMSPAALREQLDPDDTYSFDLYMPALLGRMLNADHAELPRYHRMLDALQAELEADTSPRRKNLLRHVELVRLCWAHRDLPLHQRAPLLAQHPLSFIATWAPPFFDPALLESDPERVVEALLCADSMRLLVHGEIALIYLYVPEIARRAAPLLYPITPHTFTKRERFDRDLYHLDSILHLQHLTTRVVAPKTPGRNDPCACGSGKKYKKCCGAAEA